MVYIRCYLPDFCPGDDQDDQETADLKVSIFGNLVQWGVAITPLGRIHAFNSINNSMSSLKRNHST